MGGIFIFSPRTASETFLIQVYLLFLFLCAVYVKTDSKQSRGFTMDLIQIKTVLTAFNDLFTCCLVFPAMLVLGLYLTIRLRFIQLSKLKLSFIHLVRQNKGAEGTISHFEAICAVLAGNFGTGNISGMALAITTGGPGSLVWMWLMAFLGAGIQYASCVLAVRYRTLNEDHEYVGGPMYYISRGLGLKWLAVLFAVMTLFGAITIGNFVQINSMTLPLAQMGMTPFWSSVVLAVVVGKVVLGGMTRVAKFASFIVPFKACMYMGVGFLILALHYEKVWPAFQLMFAMAWDSQSVAGGVLGYGVLKAVTVGFERAIFATDAGTGIVPILQAGARTTHPVLDGVVTLVTPVFVMLVCTMTGLILIITDAFSMTNLVSTNMVTYAFQEGLRSPIGAYVVIVSLVLFGYTTVLAWACCGEKAMVYLFGRQWGHLFRYLYICLIPVGALVPVYLVWTLADICVTIMLLSNMVSIAWLSKEVIQETREYFQNEERLLLKVSEQRRLG